MYKLYDILIGCLSIVVLLLGAYFSDLLIAKAAKVEEYATLPVEPRDQIYGIEHTGEKVLWMAGNNGKINRSDDAGKTWQVQHTGCIDHLQDIDSWDEKRAVAVGNNGLVIVTKDGGNTWVKVEVPKSTVTNKLIKVKTYDNGVAWAVGMMGMILKTEDWGSTWKRWGEEQDFSFNDIAFMDSETGVIVGEFGRILRTTDGGKTWIEVSSPVENSLMAVSFRNHNEGVAVGLGGIVLTSSDGGSTWNRITNSGTLEHLYAIGWHANKWIGIGRNGTLIIGDVNGVWKAQRLSKTEFFWHTDMASIKNKLFVVGATQGVFDLENGTWSYLR